MSNIYPIIEPCALADPNTRAIDASKLSVNIPVLELIAREWGLKLSNARQFRIAMKILKMSVTNN